METQIVWAGLSTHPQAWGGSWLPFLRPTWHSEHPSHRPRGGVALARTGTHPDILPRKSLSVVTMCPLPPLTNCSTHQAVQDGTASTNTMSTSCSLAGMLRQVSKMSTKKKGTSTGPAAARGANPGCSRLACDYVTDISHGLSTSSPSRNPDAT